MMCKARERHAWMCLYWVGVRWCEDSRLSCARHRRSGSGAIFANRRSLNLPGGFFYRPLPVSAESSLRTRTVEALYHVPAQSGSAAREIPQRERIPSQGTLNRYPNGLENLKATIRNPFIRPKQVRLPLQWCVYFRALRSMCQLMTFRCVN